MQHGIGRAGYRLLATVLFAVGLVGLGMAWYAAVQDALAFVHMGLGLTAAGLLWLYFFTFVLSHEPPAPRRAVVTSASVEPEPASPAPKAPVSFEYTDAEPAARAAPEKLVMPPAFEEEAAGPSMLEAAAEVSLPARPARESSPEPKRGPARPTAAQEPGAWPAPRGKHPRAPVRSPAPRAPPVEAAPGERARLTERYTRRTPMVRKVLGEGGDAVQTVTAERVEGDFDPDWAPKDKIRGRCSKCKAVILAPTARPVRLACPQCGHTKLLE